MKKEDIERKISLYIDGELPSEEQGELLRQLDISAYAKEYLDKQKTLKQAIKELNPKLAEHERFNEYWPNISAKISRGLGMILVILGIVANLLYGLYIFAINPAVNPVEKTITFVIVSGLLLCFISVAHQRIREAKTDKYKDVMK